MSSTLLRDLIKELAKAPARPQPASPAAEQKGDGGGAGESPIRNDAREGWIEAVGSLIQTVKGWINGVDDEKLVKFEENEYHRNEESIGEYSVPGLTIRIGPRQVDLVPVAFSVLNPLGLPAEGRVDLTNGIERYRLYRMEVLRDRPGRESFPPWAIDRGGLAQLSPYNFAAAFQSLIE
jgi:hypothetical protein